MLTIILLILFLCFFAHLSWRNLLWAVAFVIAFLPTYLIRFSVGPLPMTLLEAMVLILFAVWFIKLKMKNEKLKITIQNLKSWWWIILLWLAIATISVFVSPDLRAAAGIWKAYFIEPILFLIVFLNVVKEKKDLNLIFYALGFSALYISVFAIYQKFTGIAITNPIWQAVETRRVTSFYGYPNAVGLYLAPIVTLFFGWLINNLRVTRYALRVTIFQILVIAASLAAIIFARSEGAYAGILAGLFFLGVFTKKLRWPTVAVSAILALTIFFVPQFKNYTWQQITFQNDSGKVRLSQWQETWNMLKDRPLLGAGLAGYQQILAPYHKAKHIEIYLYPHDLFLNFWSELGLLGVITFILIAVQFFYFGFKNSIVQLPNYPITQYPNIPLIAAMLTLLIHGLVDVPYFKNDLSILFWLLVGLSLIQSRAKNLTTPEV